MITNDPLTFQGSYDSSNFITSTENIKELIRDFKLFLWQKNPKIDFNGIDLDGKFLHMKLFSIELFNKGISTDIFSFVTSANISKKAWGEDPINLECAIMYRKNTQAIEINNFLSDIKTMKYIKVEIDEVEWSKIRQILYNNDKRLTEKTLYLRDQIIINDFSNRMHISEFLHKKCHWKINNKSGINKISMYLKYLDCKSGEYKKTEKIEYNPQVTNDVSFNNKLFKDYLPPTIKDRLPISLVFSLHCDFEYPDIEITKNVSNYFTDRSEGYYLNKVNIDDRFNQYDEIIYDNGVIKLQEPCKYLTNLPKNIRFRRYGNGKRIEVVIKKLNIYLENDPLDYLKKYSSIKHGDYFILNTSKITNIDIEPSDIQILLGNKNLPLLYKEKNKNLFLYPIICNTDKQNFTFRIQLNRRFRLAVKNNNKVICSFNPMNLYDNIQKNIKTIEVIPTDIFFDDIKKLHTFISEESNVKFIGSDNYCVIVYQWGQLNPYIKPRVLKANTTLKLGCPNTSLIYRIMTLIDKDNGLYYLGKEKRIPIRLKSINMIYDENYIIDTNKYPNLKIYNENWIYEDQKSETEFYIEYNGKLIEIISNPITMKGLKQLMVYPIPQEMYKHKAININILCIPKSDYISSYFHSFKCKYINNTFLYGDNYRKSIKLSDSKEVVIPIPFKGYKREELIFGRSISWLDSTNYKSGFPYRIQVDGKTPYFQLFIKVREYHNGQFLLVFKNTMN